MLTVGPHKFQRKGDIIEAGLNKHLNISAGLTIMIPKTEHYEDSNMFWFILGGPPGNLALTMGSLAVVFALVMIAP